jgi:hypothetical protein
MGLHPAIGLRLSAAIGLSLGLNGGSIITAPARRDMAHCFFWPFPCIFSILSIMFRHISM